MLSELRALLTPGERAWVYGSLIWGGYGEHSDVDIALAGVSRDKLAEIERRIGRAAKATVDLSELAELPPALRERVERDGVRVP